MNYEELMQLLAASEVAQIEARYDESVRLARAVLAELTSCDILSDTLPSHEAGKLKVDALLRLVAVSRVQGNFDEGLTLAEDALGRPFADAPWTRRAQLDRRARRALLAQALAARPALDAGHARSNSATTVDSESGAEGYPRDTRFVCAHRLAQGRLGA